MQVMGISLGNVENFTFISDLLLKIYLWDDFPWLIKNKF